MAFNGSGTFNLPTGNPVVVNTTVNATVHNNTNTEIATALSNCVTRDGQSPPTGILPMAGFKFTGLGAGTGNGESVNYDQTTLKTTATGSAILPTGTTAQRDVTPRAGYTRFNSDYGKPEVYSPSGGWSGLGGASGSGGDAFYYSNDRVVNNATVIGGVTFKTIASGGLVTNNVVTDTTNNLVNGAYVALDSFTGTLPANLTLGAQYFVVNSITNTSFQLSLTSGGAAITFTGAAGQLVLSNGKLINAGSFGKITFNARVDIPTGSRYVIAG